MYTKKNGRVSYRSGKRSNFKRNNTFINKSRNKGNVTQQYNKYLKLAKEASSSGDRIQSELYYQYTDHYYRVMVELGISFEEHEGSENKSIENRNGWVCGLGHGINKDTPEKNVHLFIENIRKEFS